MLHYFLEFVEQYDKAITVLSTVAIAIFTIVLAIATRSLVRMARQQERSSRTHERAYVLAGGGGGIGEDGTGRDAKRVVTKRSDDGQPLEMEIRMELTNLGRTPAFIDRLCWFIRPLNNLPIEPEYGDWQPGGMGLSPGQTFQTRIYKTYRFDWIAPYVAYGRVEYKDVFGAPHYSGFLLEIQKKPNEWNFIHPPIAGQYWKYWDKD